MEQSKNKKTMLTIIGIAILVIGLVGVTYAFFNYTRTGSANVIRVGRISFVTRQTNTINLTNLFPIDPTDANAMNDNTKVGTLEIEIEGDTDYSGGIEYLVSSVDSSITTGTGKIVPLSLAVTVAGLGTSNANYFTARENTNVSIYKKLVGDTLVGDQMLLVGYIKPNTTSGTIEGINGSITIKAYLDKNKILISDTYDGTESDNMGTTNSKAEGKTVLTTTEWNALQNSGVSFKVKVEANEGIWVNQSLDDIVRVRNLNSTTNQPIMDNISSEFVTSNTGINFNTNSSDTNGKGVYMRAGTENDAYPITYYRGAVEDNNVVFANKCWKMVRTTDTGGVKMIYNGELSNSYVSGNAINREKYINVLTPMSLFTYDTTDNSWNVTITDNSYPSIFFNVPAGANYSLAMTATFGPTTGGTYYFYKNGSRVYSDSRGGGLTISYTYSYGTLSETDVVGFSFTGNGSDSSPITFKLKMQQNSTAISQSSYSLVGEAFNYNDNTKKWTSTVEPNKRAGIGFNVSTFGDYFINFTNPGGGLMFIYKNGSTVSTALGTNSVKLLNLQPTDQIIVDYSQYDTSANGVVEFYISEAENVGVGCDNTGNDTQIMLSESGIDTNAFPFNPNSDSLAYNGYMYGTLYTYSDSDWTNNAKFGSSFTWDGTNYKLVNATETTPDATHHYSCNQTDANATCSELRYVFYGTFANYYITLTGGDGIEEAITKMQTNTTDSIAKAKIETWYASNMTNYTNKIEDTIYCNDRSMNTQTNRWIANGGDLTEILYYAPYGRMYTTYSPSLSCKNKNDAFTWENGNGNKKLTYPVGMITSDEVMLAGGRITNTTFYLYTGKDYWTMSPSNFNFDAFQFLVAYNGGMYGNYDVYSNYYGLRPVISLKTGTPVVSGTGTIVDPYIIG